MSPPRPSPDGRAALVVVPLSAAASGEQTTRSVAEIRAVVRDGLPAGVTAQVTGGAGFTADINSAFDGADVRLLVRTAAVVALLLLITYRSPLLWMIPLTVVALADQATAALLAVVSHPSSLPFDPSTSGIVSVLVLGAGTDYALLLIARYREELRKSESGGFVSRGHAVTGALVGAGPAILASGATVVLALLTLVVAEFGGNRAIGVGGAIGIALALVFGLTLLPTALVLCPRGVFWPLVPVPERARRGAPSGVWRRIGAVTDRRPGKVIVASTLVLGTLAIGTLTTGFGHSQADTFRTKTESVAGLRTLGASFPAGRDKGP